MSKVNTAETILARLVPHWSGCLLWVGTCSSGRDGGYGWVKWNRKFYRVHRLMYEQFYGPIPEGMWVLHKCDTRNCANPNHLFLGTPADNVIDMIQKGRAPHQVGTHREKNRTHCLNGHEYTEANTSFRSKPKGRKARVCITCKRAIFNKWWHGSRISNSRGHLVLP